MSKLQLIIIYSYFASFLTLWATAPKAALAEPSAHNGNCFWCMMQHKGFDFEYGYQKLSIIDDEVDNHFCTFKNTCTDARSDLSWRSCEKGISTCLMIQREHLGTHVVNDVQGLGDSGSADSALQQEQVVEFVVDANLIRTVQILNLQQEDEAYYSLNVYRLEERMVTKTLENNETVQVQETVEVPISILNKELLIATYNPSHRELEFARTD